LQPKGAAKPQCPSGHTQRGIIIKVPETEGRRGKRGEGESKQIFNLNTTTMKRM